LPVGEGAFFRGGHDNKLNSGGAKSSVANGVTRKAIHASTATSRRTTESVARPS
jgi:hypothetical protein